MEAKVMIQELAKALATKNSIGQKEAAEFVQTFFQVIIRSIRQDKYVKIKGLGTFKQIEVESRESMNIHTGERFEIQGHMKISFTPDAALRDAVNKPFAHFETIALNDDVTESELEAIDQEFRNQEETEDDAAVVAEEIPAEETPVPSEALISPINPEESVSEPVTTEESPTDESEVDPSISEEIPAEEPVITEEFPAEESVAKPFMSIEDSAKEPEVPERPKEPEQTVQKTNEDLSQEALELRYKWNVGYDDDDEYEEEDEDDSHKRKIRIALIAVALIAVGSLIGFLVESMIKPKEVEVMVYDTIYVEKKVPVIDTLKTAEPLIQKEETHPDESQLAPAAQAKTTPAVQATKPSGSKSAATSSAKSADSQAASGKSAAGKYSQYPQLPGGAYWITGTAQTYKLGKGETIRIIAERFFGSRQMALYIVRYNQISDPDHVAEGMVLNIPKLEKK